MSSKPLPTQSLLELIDLFERSTHAIADGDPNLFLIERRTKGLVELATNLSGEYAAKTCCVVGVGGKLIRSDKPLVASLVRAINQGSEFVADYPTKQPASTAPIPRCRWKTCAPCWAPSRTATTPVGWRCKKRWSSTPATSSWWAYSSPAPMRRALRSM